MSSSILFPNSFTSSPPFDVYIILYGRIKVKQFFTKNSKIFNYFNRLRTSWAVLLCTEERQVSGMTEKRKRFAEEYLFDFNATQAAIRAGYSERTAYSIGQRLLKDVEVKTYIDAALARLQAENVADAQEVMEYLTSVMRGESQSSVLCLIGDGMQETIEKRPDEKERLKAAELLGKRYGLYTDKVDIDADMELNISIDYGDDTG